MGIRRVVEAELELVLVRAALRTELNLERLQVASSPEHGIDEVPQGVGWDVSSAHAIHWLTPILPNRQGLAYHQL